MNGLVKAEFGKVTQTVKGLTAEVIHLKTKTKVDVKFDSNPIDRIMIEKDVALLDLEGSPIDILSIIIEGAASFGRLFNRSRDAFRKVGISLSESDWEATAGEVKVAGQLVGSDFPFFSDLISRLALRATKAMNHTHHSLTTFDLKQATGVTYDAQSGMEGAKDLKDWFDARELILREEKKAEMADAAKAKRASAKAARVKEWVGRVDTAKTETPKAEVGAKVETETKNLPAKKKGGKTASLTSIE